MVPNVIQKKDCIRLLGVSIVYKDGEKKDHAINMLWDEFYQRIGCAMDGISFPTYGICIPVAASHTVYVAGFEITRDGDIPSGFSEFSFGDGLYAVFHHKGQPSSLNKTFEKVLTEWIPRSSYRALNEPSIVKFDEEFRISDSNSRLELWVPVELV